MKTKLAVAFLILLGIGGSTFAQGFRVDSTTVQEVSTTVVPGINNVLSIPASAQVAFCNSPANAVPCTNKATTFTSISLGTPCSTSTQIVLTGTSSCVASPDANGNFGFWVAAGTYAYTVTLPSGINLGPYTVSMGIPSGTALNAITTVNLNAVLTVGIATGQYASLQAAHDAAPASGATIQVMGNATPFGPSFNTPLAITKPVHIIVDDANFTAYSGASAMISCSGVNGVTIEGSGHTGSDAGTNGTTLNFSNSAANGIAFANCSGYVLRNFNIVGPGQGVGTGKGLVMTSNRGDITDVNVRAVGSDCVTIDGSATNANVTNIIGGRASQCGGNDYLAKGTNGNLVRFIGTDGGPSTGDCYNIASLGNKFISTNCSPALAANTCYHFVSGGNNNSGDTFCDGPSTTGYKFEVGANGNTINNSADVGGTLVSDLGSGNRYFPTIASVWNAWNAGQFGVNGSTSGVTNVISQNVASGTLTLPAATDTLVGKATTDSLSNKNLVAPTIGSGTALNKYYQASGAITPAATAANQCVEQTFTPAAFNGVVNAGDNLTSLSATATMAANGVSPVAGARLVANGIAITYCNSTAGALTAPAVTITITGTR